MTAEIDAERYDTSGRTVEHVKIFVNRLGDRVHLHIEGRLVAKNYVMNIDEWHKMCGTEGE